MLFLFVYFFIRRFFYLIKFSSFIRYLFNKHSFSYAEFCDKFHFTTLKVFLWYHNILNVDFESFKVIVNEFYDDFDRWLSGFLFLLRAEYDIYD